MDLMSMTYMTMIARPPKILFFIYLLTGLEFQARFVSSQGLDLHVQRRWGRTAASLRALRFSRWFKVTEAKPVATQQTALGEQGQQEKEIVSLMAKEGQR